MLYMKEAFDLKLKEKILNDNLEKDGKYIVFLPITKKCEDEDGNPV